jgi:hypothetical protein
VTQKSHSFNFDLAGTGMPKKKVQPTTLGCLFSLLLLPLKVLFWLVLISFQAVFGLLRDHARATNYERRVSNGRYYWKRIR